MHINILGTMRTREFKSWFSSGEFDAGNVVVVVSTSYADDVASIRSEASNRGLAGNVLVLEYDDVENLKRPTAITAEMASAAVSFLRGASSEGTSFLMVCDGGFSRSAAMCAAWARISGENDVDFWIQPEKYSPNLLVYRRMLAAAGINLKDDQIERLGELKEAMRMLRIKAGGKSASN